VVASISVTEWSESCCTATTARSIIALPLTVRRPHHYDRSRSWLVGVQVYRVVGVIFLILRGAGQLPREFALPAGTGDVIVGLLALPVAWAASTGSRRALLAAYVWNGLGILDFIVAIATGFLSSPSRIQLLALDHPSLIASAYPLVMIPVFLVPLSSILHGLCLWKIRRQSRVGVANAHSSRRLSGQPRVA
jgi:hypothetical protein